MSSQPFEFDVGTSIGAIEVGAFLSMFLFGLVTLQVFSYFQNFPKDAAYLKAMVALIWLIELARTVLSAQSSYQMTILSFGDPNNWKFGGLGANILLEGFICLIVQGYFTTRLWKLLRNRYIAIFCWALLFFKFCCAIITTAASSFESKFSDYTKHYGWLVYASLIMGTVLDVIITIASCYYFYQRRLDSLETTTKVLDQLVVWTIQTGLATSLIAISMVICFHIAPNNFIWIVMFMCLVKFYSASFLATLNARIRFRRTLERSTTDFASHELRTDQTPRNTLMSVGLSILPDDNENPRVDDQEGDIVKQSDTSTWA